MIANNTPTTKARDQFLQLRSFIFNKLKQLYDEGACGKSYEGAMRIIEVWPEYWDDQQDVTYRIELDCYLYGPSRHYSWDGKTLAEAVQKADLEIRGWEKQYE